MKRLLLTLAFALTALPAAALDAAQRDGLDARIAAFGQATTASDYPQVIAVMPPAMIAQMAGQLGVSVEDLRAALVAQVASVMESAMIEAFAMDTDSMVTGETADGMPYAFIPTFTRVSAPGIDAMEASSTTLALEDGGDWYLVRIQQPAQYDMVKAAYPGFTDIALP